MTIVEYYQALVDILDDYRTKYYDYDEAANLIKELNENADVYNLGCKVNLTVLDKVEVQPEDYSYSY